MNFKLFSAFKPTGDQPEAIAKLVQGVLQGEKDQVLLGVTGSGKTFTVANVIETLQRPTLVLAHNKTLAAQLYNEFKHFFPNNAVEYFVSYYDYYQPEAFIPTTNTYIEKDLSINEEIERLRLNTTSSLLSGRRDVLVVASVSCLYGIGNPDAFSQNVIQLSQGETISRTKLLNLLVNSLYSRTTTTDFNRGNFRVKGDLIDIFPAYAEYAIRIHFFDNEIERIETIDPISAKLFDKFEQISIYPANLFVTTPDTLQAAIHSIQDDLVKQVAYLNKLGKTLEAKRLLERTEFDLEMIRELGYCSGIENYSRYLDGREAGTRPFCLIDYFPNDFLMIIDESHVTIPQVHAMYGGDRSRKETLVEFGFRLPSALDNRPLQFEEFRHLQNQTLYISATPADYELQLSDGVFVEQLIRPTGLLDPVIDVRPTLNQIDDLMEEINLCIEKNERVLITTLTKRMAEELSKFFTKMNLKTRYIHSDIDTLERIEIMQGLRAGTFDVLIGVNLLREGLDLPEVSLVAVMDADKEGFLRSHRSLTQTVGRAARNLNGKAIFYADKITDSMQITISETARRREIQLAYNEKHHKTPQALVKSLDNSLTHNPYQIKPNLEKKSQVADTKNKYLTKDQIEKQLKILKSQMEKAAKDLDFLEAARLRDEINAWKTKL